MAMRKFGNEKIRELENQKMSSDKKQFFDRFDLSYKSDWSGGGSKGNGVFQKEAKGGFGEKWLLGGWGQLIESLQEAYTNLGRLVQKGYISC